MGINIHKNLYYYVLIISTNNYKQKRDTIMTVITKLEKISLKDYKGISESIIQRYIYDNPSVLGLPGELEPHDKERIQPNGGRLDLLFRSSDGDRRFEVEIQLGGTDESHIIRTIEYWDIERKRYPQYDHYAVIVAEEVTGRLFNVISLFNGSIPLYVLQMTAYKSNVDGEIHLTFTKVLDVVRPGTDEEDVVEITDRNYWERERSTKRVLSLVDHIFESLQLNGRFQLRYTKYYIGITDETNGPKNFILFYPRKGFLLFDIRLNEGDEYSAALDAAGIDARYLSRDGRYEIRLKDKDEYTKNEEIIRIMVNDAMKRMLNDE